MNCKETAIDVKELTKSYGKDCCVLKGVNLAIPKGPCFACGVSTAQENYHHPYP